MAEKGDYGNETTPYDFITKIKVQDRITVPTEIWDLGGYEIGDYVKVKLWLHKKSD